MSGLATTPYVELHCHSAYSFLDGASLPEELAAAALELGHHTLALTDHDGVYGSMEFAHAARAIGLRPIHGAELSLDDGRHLTLLVGERARLAQPLPPADARPRRHPRAPAGPDGARGRRWRRSARTPRGSPA